jgi:hypothetical protein
MVQEVEDPIERVKILRDSLKHSFSFVQGDHPQEKQEEKKGDSDEEDEKQSQMEKNGAVFCDSVG